MATNTYKRGLDRLKNRKNIPSWMKQRINHSYYPKSDINPDTEKRLQIHRTIKDLVSQGKAKSEIIEILIEKFPESDLRKFFDSYAQHHIDKIKDRSSGEGR